MVEILLVAGGEALSHAWWLIGAGLIFGLFMAWSIGANDVANSMGTSVGSKALTLKQAIILAAIVEFSGALLVGRHVSDKIRSKIFDAGENATGEVELVFKEGARVVIPTSTLFKTHEGVEFKLTAELAGTPHRTTSTNGRFVLPLAKVVAVKRGQSANVKKDISLEPSDPIPHLVDVVTSAAFGGGRDGAFDKILHLYAYGMLSALLAAATWLLVATYFGLPVSTTHSIVGSVVGFGMVALPWNQIMWGEVGKIIASWVVSPVLAGVASFLLFTTIHQRVLVQRDMVASAKRLAPIFMFSVFLTIFLVTLYKGLKPVLKPLGLQDLEFWQAFLWATPLALLATLCCMPLVRKVRVDGSWSAKEGHNPALYDEVNRMAERCKKLALIATGAVGDELKGIQTRMEALESRLSVTKERSGGWATPEMRATEKIFVYLQILSACALAFAHGANDVANAVGPLAGVIFVANEGVAGLTMGINESGWWGVLILVLGGIGIVVGLATWGWRVIDTIGKKITELTPTRGFAAEFGAAVTILVASRQGLPISTTHTLVGAVLGVGLARGVGALNFRVIRNIAVSWVITLPAGAGLTIIFYFLFKSIFGE
jgi:PiT family inorganic phosphate transporter